MGESRGVVTSGLLAFDLQHQVLLTMKLVRQIIDPQKEINKRRSKALHLLNVNQVIFDEGAVKDKQATAIEMSRPDGMIEKRKGYEFIIDKNTDLSQIVRGV